MAPRLPMVLYTLSFPAASQEATPMLLQNRSIAWRRGPVVSAGPGTRRSGFDVRQVTGLGCCSINSWLMMFLIDVPSALSLSPPRSQKPMGTCNEQTMTAPAETGGVRCAWPGLLSRRRHLVWSPLPAASSLTPSSCRG